MSAATDIGIALIPPTARLLEALANGTIRTPAEAARAALGLGLAAVPHAELVKYLTEAGRAAGEALADAAEYEKFPQG